MKKIYFIINPISGSGKQANELNSALIKSVFPSADFEIVVEFTKSHGEAMLYTRDAIAKKADIIVACGGDGTINEVASSLVNTDIALGIIPRGSGNGLATHFGLKKEIFAALQIIKSGHQIKMDVGKVGSRYFFSNCGTGIVAEVIHQYDIIPERKLFGYFKAGISSFSKIGKSAELSIIVNDLSYTSKHVFVSNSSVMGYNMTLTPQASVQDGMFDIVLLPANSALKFVVFSVFALLRKHHLLAGVKVLKSNKIMITSIYDHLKIQIDGEALTLKQSEIEITLIPKALNIIIPKTQKIA